MPWVSVTPPAGRAAVLPHHQGVLDSRFCFLLMPLSQPSASASLVKVDLADTKSSLQPPSDEACPAAVPPLTTARDALVRKH